MRRWGALALALVTLTAAASARAQSPEQSDSTVSAGPRDPNHGPMMLAFAGFGAALILAPPALLYLPQGHQDPALGFSQRRPHLTVFSAGGFSDAERGPNAWSWTEEVEVRQGRLFGGYRRTTFEFSRRTAVDAVQIGYAVRAFPWAEGGLALGYQSEGGDRLDDGVTVALPVRAGGRLGTVKVEPSYRFSDVGLRMAWGIQYDSYALPDPLLLGVRLDIQEMRRHDDTIGTYALFLGARW